MVRLNSLDYCELMVFGLLLQFPRKIGLFVLTRSFQKPMNIQDGINLGQKCSDISHAMHSFVPPGNSACAFIPLVVGEKVPIAFQFI